MASAESARSGDASRLVLVVDDDPDVRRILTDLLGDEGYDVVTASDGQVALERARERPPAVILLDYQMPRCDGPRFAAAYRQLPAPHAPIVLLTAAASARQRAAEIGADAFIGKPFDLRTLYEVVERYAAA
jgi:two-component system, chemotaxis family, chemotaxis protein CheY